MSSRLSVVFLLATSLLIPLLSGCSSNSSSDTVTVTGAAQKGLFTDLKVVAYPVDEQTGEPDTSQPIDAITDGSTFQLNLPSKGIYLLEADGTFINELNGESLLLEVPMESLIEVDLDSLESNINLLTHLYTQQVFDRIAEGASLEEAMSAAKDFVIQSLGYDPEVDFTALDLTEIPADATLDNSNLQLLLFSSATLQQLSPTDLMSTFGTLIDGFAPLRDTQDAQDELAVLTGSGAEAIYLLAQENLPLPDLPVLADNLPVFTCDPLPCDWVPQPGITASVIGQQTLEADGYASFLVQLSGPAIGPVEIIAQSFDGSATAGSDYQPVQQSLLFQLGSTSQKIRLTALLDNQAEPNEQFGIQIESLTDGISVSQGTSNLTLTEGLDGSDLYLATDLVSIEHFCITGIGDGNNLVPGDACLGNEPTAIPDNANAAMSMEISMAVVCGGVGCRPTSRDWAVEFLLEAFTLSTDLRGDTIFTLQDSTVFAVHRFPGGQLTGLGEESQNYPLYAHIDTDFKDLFKLADSNGWNLRLKARLFGLDEVAALDNFNTPLVLPDTLQADDLSLPYHISSIVEGSVDNSCNEGQYQLTAEFSLDGSVFQDSTVCVTHDTENDTLTLADGQINLAGNTLQLPPFHSSFYRNDELSRPDVRGLPTLTVPEAPDGFPQLYIHADGLPFAFPVRDIYIDSGGIKIAYDQILYLHSGEYSSSDSRSMGVTSNDILYQDNQSILIQQLLGLTEGGIQASLTLSGGNGEYAFPKGEISWDSFDVQIANGRINNSTRLENISFTLEQNGRCTSLNCVDTLTELHQVAGASIADRQGAILAATSVTTGNASQPRWGALPSTPDTPYIRSAFTRPDDLAEDSSAILALPGYLFSADSELGLDASLYAHHGLTTGIDGDPLIIKHQLGSLEALEGNLWPTGITVGPENYSDPSNGGAPSTGTGRDLTGSLLELNNGVDGVFGLTVNVGAKYVLRNAGVTGVFNIAEEELISPISFYGYNLDFDRFAFRLVDNEMDDFSWIDGQLRVPGIDDPLPDNPSVSAGSAGFDLKFASLLLECNGGFSGANPLPDPANPQSLHAWNAGTDIFAMSFESSGADFCATAPQVLTLDQTLDMHALDGLAALLDVEWLPDGSVGGSRVMGHQDFILDGSDEHLGFGIRTKTGRLQTLLGSELYGVLKLDNAYMTSYLWQSPRVDIRLSNTSTQGAERSIVTTTGTIDAGDDLTNPEFNLLDNTQYDLDMKYNWGHSFFDFNLPVYYSSGGGLSAPRFTGRYKESDLMVLKAGAGIEFIEADDTKLNFGLSADIPKIQELPISLDLGDALSIGRMDDFLVQSGLGDFSLQALLGPIQEKLDLISRLSGNGLSQAIQTHLNEAIDAISGAQIVTLTQSMSQLQSLPNQMQAVLENDTQSELVINLALNTRSLHDQLESLRQNLSEIDSPQQTIEIDAVNRQLEEIVATLDMMRSQAAVTLEAFRSNVTRVLNFIDQAESQLQRFNDALAELAAADGASAVFEYDASTCLTGELNVDNAGHLTPVIELNNNIEALINGYVVLDLVSQLQGLTAAAGEQLHNLLGDSQNMINSLSEQLLIEWNDGIPILRQSICSESSDSFTQNLDEQLVVLQAWSQTLQSSLSTLTEQSELGQAVMMAVSGYDTLLDYLDVAIQVLSQPIEAEVFDPTWPGDPPWQQINNSFAAAVDELPIAIDFLLADADSTGLDLFNGVAFPVIETAAAFPNELRELVQGLAAFNVAGASFTPEQFRAMLVNMVMDTAAMNDLLAGVQEFTDPVLDELGALNLNLNDHINALIKSALAAVNPQINDLLEQATSAIPLIPLKSAGLDGSAMFQGYDLDQMHMTAGWEMEKEIGGIAGPSFQAALDIWAADAGDKNAPCTTRKGEKSFRVEISASDVPASLFGDGTTLDDVHLGFILAPGDLLAYQPIGISGGIGMTTEVEYAGFSLHRFDFETALGLEEVYIGAGGSGAFGIIDMDLNAFFGRTCDDSVVSAIDPEAASLLPFNGNAPFTGLYLRGGLTMPIVTAGCVLDLSFRGSSGHWITIEPVPEVGGIIGGGALGTLACIGSVRGQVDAAASIDLNGDTYFAGQAFAVAGAGADCDRHTWTSVSRSRKDRWCGTGDIQVGVKYQDDEWSYDPDKPSAIH